MSINQVNDHYVNLADDSINEVGLNNPMVGSIHSN